MKVKVQICYAAPSENHEIVVELKGSPKGQKLMNAVEKAVEKKMEALAKDNAGHANWTRWNKKPVQVELHRDLQPLTRPSAVVADPHPHDLPRGSVRVVLATVGREHVAELVGDQAPAMLSRQPQHLGREVESERLDVDLGVSPWLALMEAPHPLREVQRAGVRDPGFVGQDRELLGELLG